MDEYIVETGARAKRLFQFGGFDGLADFAFAQGRKLDVVHSFGQKPLIQLLIGIEIHP